MIPKNHKIFIKETAKELDKNEVLIEDAIGFFYTAVRKTLTDMVYPNININNLGTFKIKRTTLKKLHKKYEAHLNVLDNPESFSQMTIKKEIEQKYENVQKLSKELTKEKIRKDQIKKQRNEFITNQNLEE